MKRERNDFKTSDRLEEFVEEVDERYLYDKKNQSDIIYVESTGSMIKSRILIILAILLILLSLMSFIFGLVYINKDVSGRETTVNNYDLFVTHSNNYFGGQLDSFDKYRSSSKPYSYSLTVENNNPIDISYKVELINPSYGNDNVDMTGIEYNVFNSGSLVFSGKLTNNSINDLGDIVIESNSSDNLEFRIWSSSVPSGTPFSFKINIEA